MEKVLSNMEEKKGKTPQKIANDSRNGVVYIEMMPNTMLLWHWRIYKFFKRNRSATYSSLHNLLTGLHKNTSKDSQKIGVAGTGFFISNDTLVTNIHVVARAKTVAAKQNIATKTCVYHPEQKDIVIAYRWKVSEEPILYTIKGVIAYDAKNDLVLLKVAEKSDNHLPLGNSETVKLGDQVCTLTYANAEYKWVEGIITGIKENGWFEIKTQYSPGYSGSPVINSNGEVVGIACRMNQAVSDDGARHAFGLGRTIPSECLNALLKETGEIEPFTTWQKRPAIRAYALSLQGQRKQAQGKNRSAIAKYSLTLKLNPDIIVAYTNRGVAKASLGNHKGAIEDYNKAIELSSYDPTTYANRGHSYARIGESKAKQSLLIEARSYYQLAIDDCNKVINQDPKYANVYNGRGWTYYLLGQIEIKEGNKQQAQSLFKEAIKDADEALRLQPEGDMYRSAFYHTRGAAKASLAEHKAAIEDFDESIRLNPKKALLVHDRALSKQALGQHEAAEADFAKAKELDPHIEDKSK